MKTFDWMWMAALLAVFCGAARAEIRTETIAYEHDGVALEGYLAYDDAAGGNRPGVLVVHEWWGLNDYAKGRARQLAELGYVAFAADMYGQGKVTSDPEQAKKWSGPFQSNAKLMQDRAAAALNILRAQKVVDPQRIAAIGYCFGGAAVLQLAYSGAELAGVVSFHGSLPIAPVAPESAEIRARILICHGADDSFVPAERIAAFEQSLRAQKKPVDWQFVYYSGAVHSFTNPDSDKVGMPGVGYNAAADRRSWGHMRQFFDEIFK